METMAIKDVQKLLQCCAEIYQWERSPTFAEHAAKILPHLVDCSIATYQAVNDRPEDVMAMSRPAPEVMEHMDTWLAFMHEHPLINHQRRTNDEHALRMCDVMDTAAYHRTGLFNEFYRKVSLPYQMAVGLSSESGEVVGLVASRDGKEFTALERQLLDLFRSHVVQARRQATRYRRLVNRSRQLRGMVESLREGLVSLDKELRVKTCTRRATTLLEKHFPAAKPTGRHILPEPVRDWIFASTTSAQSRNSPAKHRRLVLTSAAGAVRFELVELEAGWTLVVEEPDVRWETSALESLGLTQREAEILLWICQGKSNPEISIIVGAGVRTVEKHVERILRKLDVESRGAAALRAIELLV